MPYNRPPLKIGLSPRFLHKSPLELGFRGKSLQYLEQSIAHWVMSLGALIFMLPSIETGGRSPGVQSTDRRWQPTDDGSPSPLAVDGTD